MALPPRKRTPAIRDAGWSVRYAAGAPRRADAATERLSSPDVRLLWHADRLGDGYLPGAWRRGSKSRALTSRATSCSPLSPRSRRRSSSRPRRICALPGAARARPPRWRSFGVAADQAAAQAALRPVMAAFPDSAAASPEAAISAGDPVQHRSRLLAQQRPSSGRVRRGLHRRGHWLVQAGSAQFRVPAGRARRQHRARAGPAHGPVAVSRPRPGQALRPRDLLDRPARRAEPARRGRRKSR